MQKKKIVVLTGAGISAESGLLTFRDAGGLWEGYDIYEVATPEGWQKNQDLVLDFYNQRREGVRNAKPNAAHYALKKLEEKFDVVIITQNIDDLHEKAGSTNILHLHGEITKAQSSRYPELVYDLGNKNIKKGDVCEKGHQLRPHVVWFGEAVPMMENAMLEASTADIFMVIGTSLAVYPAANLVHYVPAGAQKYIIDPNIPAGIIDKSIVKIAKKASEGLPLLISELLNS
ncbi:MAG: NAD-dependent deacylase [Sphingobacteriales bacterium]|nr:MAG: NAD-dependent deacylase [Sphingobacteriales bacterium]